MGLALASRRCFHAASVQDAYSSTCLLGAHPRSDATALQTIRTSLVVRRMMEYFILLVVYISITPRPILLRSYLIHLCNPLLELQVLALLVRVSFILSNTSASSPTTDVRADESHLTLPRQIPFFKSTPVQWYEEVSTTVSVW